MSSSIALPENAKEVPAVTAVKPFGSMIMIEYLTPEEMMGTKLYVKSSVSDKLAQQAYIVAFGPNLKAEDIGLNVGNRVIVTGGNFTPVPNVDGSTRVRGVTEVHNVKAVLAE
jgi:hypothetical protein